MDILWEFIRVFIVGGLICVIAQILIDKTKLTPARILVTFVVAGVFLTAIGIYFGMRDITGQEITGWLCVLGAAPFAACGFFKYHGMTAEQFLWAVIKSELLYPKKLVFQSEDIYYSCMQETISLGEKNQKDGAEIIKEREQKAEAKQRKKRKGRSDAFD